MMLRLIYDEQTTAVDARRVNGEHGCYQPIAGLDFR
jgi:hypothetical protein